MDLNFGRIAIINRGEPAMRLLHAVRELNQQHGWHLQTIAFYTDPDRRALFVREADEAVCLGEATFVDPHDGQRKSSYLDYGRLRRALVESRADAAWVGWGFVAEHAEFADLCDSLSVNFIGPSGEVMRKLGDKIASKRLAEAANVPVAPWSGGPLATLAEARLAAERLGYPLMIKASAGGGGRGIRRAKVAADLADAFGSARSEALKAFGDDTVFVEQMVEGARHVEVQVVGDKHGTVWAVGVRDCTVQRRNQKVIEEAPSPVLDAEEDRALRASAARLAQAAAYTSAGTVEYLFDPVTRRFFFMEMNTRLQVEHPVTEQTTGLDLVKLQLHIAAGGRLEGEPPPHVGHAIEVRLNAEDPDNNFAPAPGRIELFELPTGPGIRIDTGVSQGDQVPPDFDSMIAKLIACGRDRAEALGRLRRALLECAVVIRGGASNKAFLLELLSHPDVVSGQIDIGWLDRLAATRRTGNRPLADIALLRAAIDVYEEELAIEKAQFFGGAARGRPVVRAEIGHSVELACGGQSYELEVCKLGHNIYRLRVEGRSIEAKLDRQGAYAGWLSCGGQRYRVLSMVDGPTHLVEVDGMPHRISRDEGGMVRAPSPAVVLAVTVSEGQSVQQGDKLLVLEAMKMEMAVAAPFAGKVRSIEVLPNQQVDAGAALLMIEAEATVQAEQGERIAFPAASAKDGADSPGQCMRALLTDLERLLLGYDIDQTEAGEIRKQRGPICDQLPPDDPELWRLENESIAILADLLPLFRREANGDPVSAEEYLQSYLRAMDGGERLPQSFLDKLSRALRHYGIEELQRTPALESALLFLHKSRARLRRSVDQVFGLLERRLQHAEVLTARATPEFRAMLDTLIGETHGTFLPLNDLARQLRYVLYDRPFFDQARTEIYAKAAHSLARLIEAPPAKELEARRQQLEELVDCPQPMITYLAKVYGTSGKARRLAVEVMLRRYYHQRALRDIRVELSAGHEIAQADFAHQGRPGHVLTIACDFDGLGAALAALRGPIEAYPAGDDIYVDVCAAHSDIDDQPALSKAIANALASAGRMPLRRVCVALVKPGDLATIRYFSFLTTEMGFVEQEILRGIHPMHAERLELWRLENFEIKQLYTAEDIYLFHAVARANPKDERLFAIADVRDVTPVYDDDGEVQAIPGLERLFLEALATIRDFQSRRNPRDRLHWNRVLLFVRPVVELSLLPTVRKLAHRLSPAAKHLGLEKAVTQLDLRDPETGKIARKVIHTSTRSGTGLEVRISDPGDQPLRPVSPYAQRVVLMRRLGLVYPYEIIRMLTPARDGGVDTEFPPGTFVEHDLDASDHLVPVEREPGNDTANIVVGVIENYTKKYPEGMRRVICLGDGSRSMGALAEPECRRLIEALDLAERMQVPFEWFAVSSGAMISMEVGTEGLDWIARVVRRLVEFTQAGGEVNIIVCGVNVGGQSYWNAEATMLMHTRGILVMTPNASMVLTGKRALDYSGGVSAEDNQGIGGVERIMGFNGQAQYAAKDMAEACHILFRYYDHSYVLPGERWPRRQPSADARDRDIRPAPHARIEGIDFATVGEVFSSQSNPGRKKAFDIRSVMQATIDADAKPLERWAMMRLAETAVVWDAHLGGIPATLIGIESRPLTRLGFVPGDGPDAWTGGTLFPRSSKKVARAINAASGNRPVIVLANLSGFDGSPESMREWQLEYGAEIGRAVVNFDGPFIFCVISRYHGGAYVVFSGTLNENMQVAALEGSYASVIGGAPAAAVVFPRDVRARVLADPRVKEAQAALAAATDNVSRARRRVEYDRVINTVSAEKQGEVSEYFDSVHNVQRAKDVGSLHEIIAPEALRPWLVEALERGMERCSKAPAPRLAGPAGPRTPR